ncbi:radical SAM protein [Methanoplanus endosymbiosus]|uniref:Radical SAM protein n=1 Tax=Methanoplanus endosymbiosus TaxID=33865 RepID=A0A9E7PN96_9EURY|nr:radical SAM protein [Methanoplanus endosymbiosus]UUX93408.1 radical SAM protein [Methanoplanus endosymbiosus]
MRSDSPGGKVPKAVIIDGYVDEPACLGVSPYISPYVRYAAGVCAERGFKTGYYTIDQLRKNPAVFSELQASDYVIVISGVTVPGKYFAGTPATATEIMQIAESLTVPETFFGGPLNLGYSGGGGHYAEKQCFSSYDHILKGEIGAALDNALSGRQPEGKLNYEKIDRFSAAGSFIIKLHPKFPHVICEMETARGCSRSVTGGCSFCTESVYGEPVFRSPKGIFAETRALHESGAEHIRVGRQPDILAYGAKIGEEFPTPKPDVIERLFSGIRSNAPGLHTLHIDNVNPGTIAAHEEEAKEALRAIVKWHTAGDVAAFGLESADPAVISANNLKASAEEVMRAIEIVNEVGAVRRDGVPELLPGINFVTGLSGETKETYRLNLEFLHEVARRGLLVRRVNIRQVMPFEGTKAYDNNTLGMHDREFKAFKDDVRRNFDLPMLKRVFPAGTPLKEIIIEESGKTSFGRQMGSYPILVGIPQEIKEGTVTDAAVTDWGFRSVTAMTIPVKINELSIHALKYLPGVGKKRAASIIAKRPFKNIEEFRKIVGETPIDDIIQF